MAGKYVEDPELAIALQDLGDMKLDVNSTPFGLVTGEVSKKDSENIVTTVDKVAKTNGFDSTNQSVEHHVTIVFLRMGEDGTLNPSGEHWRKALEQPIPKSKDEFEPLMKAIVDKYRNGLHIRFGNLAVRTVDGHLIAVEVEILNPDFPHEPGKVYHITIKFNRKVKGRAPFCSNLFLNAAKKKHAESAAVAVPAASWATWTRVTPRSATPAPSWASWERVTERS